VLGSLPFVYQLIEKFLITNRTEPVPTLERYSLNPWLLAAIAGVVIFAAGNAVAFIGAVAVGAAGAQMEMVGFINALLVPFGMIPVVFLTGRWIGHRARGLAALVLIGAATLYLGIAAIADFALIVLNVVSEDDYAKLVGISWNERARAIPRTAAFILLFGFLGVWRGRTTRMHAYLAYLSALLPVDVRRTLLDLAYDEVTRSMSKNDAARVSQAIG